MNAFKNVQIMNKQVYLNEKRNLGFYHLGEGTFGRAQKYR